jgi:hypothetical protein
MIFIIASGMILGCKKNNLDKKLTHLEIDLNDTSQIKMSSVFSGIDYIPLETNDSCLIGSSTMRTKITEKYIYYVDNNRVIRFNNVGSFDKIIISNGRGPDQIVGPRDIALSEKYIYILGLFEVAQLDLNCRMIKRIKIPVASESIYCYPTGNLLIYNGLTLGAKNAHKASIYDSELNFKKTFWPFPETRINSGTGIRLHPDGKMIFLTHEAADTIFNMTRELPYAYLKIDFVKLSTGKYPHLMNLTICKNFIFFRYLYYPYSNPVQYKLIYLANKKQTMLTASALINDIDRGLGYLPFNIDKLTDEKASYSFLEPLEIIKRADQIRQSYHASPTENKFLEMAKMIDPGSNPVLMKCTLKESRY